MKELIDPKSFTREYLLSEGYITKSIYDHLVSGGSVEVFNCDEWQNPKHTAVGEISYHIMLGKNRDYRLIN